MLETIYRIRRMSVDTIILRGLLLLIVIFSTILIIESIRRIGYI